MYLYPKIDSLDYTERIIETNDWATYLLVGCFLLLAVAKYFYPKRFDEFVLMPLSNKYLSVYGKDDAIYHPFSMILFVVQVVCVSIFIYLLFEAFNPTEAQKNPWLFVQIATGYATFVLIKLSIEKIVANIFSMDVIIDQYLHQKLSHRNFLALLIFLGNLFFLYFYPGTSFSLLIFALTILLFNTIALISSYKKNGNLVVSNFFHFIVYLCALEISPYIILYKVFFTEVSI